MLAPNTQYYQLQLYQYRYRYWNDVTHSMGQMDVMYVAHTIRTFQNITLLTLCFETCETNCRLETTGMHASVDC